MVGIQKRMDNKFNQNKVVSIEVVHKLVEGFEE